MHAGKLLDDTMERHFDYIRHLMGRREIIVNEIMKLSSRHRGPGTPGYIDLGGKANPSTAFGGPPPLSGEAMRKEAGGGVAD